MIMTELATILQNHWSFFFLLGIGIPASIIDIKTFRIPDYLTLSALPAAFLLNLLLNDAPWWLFPVHCAAGFAIFIVIRIIGRGKMGWGDIKYAALLSALLGFFKWLDSICIAVLLALLYYIILKLFKKKDDAGCIPFAPFMTGGAILRYLLDGMEI